MENRRDGSAAAEQEGSSEGDQKIDGLREMLRLEAATRDPV